MNKDEALWVVVRAVGLVFLVLAVVDFVKLASMVGYYIYASDIFAAYVSISDTSDGQKIAMSSAKAMISKNLSSFILFGIAAYYFMRKGKFVHNVISK